MLRMLLVAFVTATVCACNKTAPSAPVALPSNLTYSISVSATTEGLTTVSAQAVAANYFSFTFDDIDGTHYIESQTGEADYQFTTSGTYTIHIRAHATHEHYIEATDTVSVEISQNTGFPKTGYTTPLSYPGYTLVWQDEFTGNTLSADWTHEIGTGNNGWGNNELQYYRSQNTEVRDDFLVITAKQEAFGGMNYTSSRLITKGMQSFQYGRIDIRAALPKGQGIWPALWMLGDNISTVGWPRCGEIDIMEMVGGSNPAAGDKTIFGTAHWDNNGQHTYITGSSPLSSGIYADEFHVFSIVWDANKITWYRDDIKYHEQDITPAALSEFRAPFFFIVNIAVGGNWPGSPNASTQFPQQMAVDYIRVFQK